VVKDDSLVGSDAKHEGIGGAGSRSECGPRGKDDEYWLGLSKVSSIKVLISFILLSIKWCKIHGPDTHRIRF
jgi:hypothetical protein